MSGLIPQYAVQYEHPRTGKVLTLGSFDRWFDAVDLLRTVPGGWIAERGVTEYRRIDEPR